jgi:hypothetical protein
VPSNPALSLQGLKAAIPPVSAAQAPTAPSGAITGISKTPAGAPASYMGPDQGPFECDNCEYYHDPSQCEKQEVIAELGPGQTGMAPVDAKGCCDYFSKGGASADSGQSNYSGS